MSDIISIRGIGLAKKKVLIRCDLDISQDDFLNTTDGRHIRSAIPAIRYCSDNGYSVILTSHLGRPKEISSKYSLEPMTKCLTRFLDKEIVMAEDVIDEDAKTKAMNLEAGETLLLGNLHFEKDETKNDENLVRELAPMVQVYTNGAFGVCHRAHSSVGVITKFFDENYKGAGFLLQKEIDFASNLIRHPARPFVAVVGGPKVGGELQALTDLLPKVGKLIISGGMAFTFSKASGYDIGNSLLEEELLEEANKVLTEGKNLGVKIHLPVDVVAVSACSQDVPMKLVPAQETPNDQVGSGTRPTSVRLFKEVISDTQMVWWNGSVGVLGIDKSSKGGTKASYYISEGHVTSAAGGGDAADVVAHAGDADEMTFISTGGGTSSELTEGKEFPDVKALRSKENE